MPTMKTPTQFLGLAGRRRSCRRYDAERDVPPEALHYCFEAVRLAPSACNQQPWHLVGVRDSEMRNRLCNEALLPGINHDWMADAPVIVALCVKLSVLTHRVAPAFSGIPYYLLDAGIAGEHLVLAAAEQGLGSCWIGWIQEKRVRRLLNIPRRVRVPALITLGYPADPDHFARPGVPRRELETMVSWERWS